MFAAQVSYLINHPSKNFSPIMTHESFKCLESWGQSVVKKDKPAVLGHYINGGSTLWPTLRVWCFRGFYFFYKKRWYTYKIPSNILFHKARILALTITTNFMINSPMENWDFEIGPIFRFQIFLKNKKSEKIIFQLFS